MNIEKKTALENSTLNSFEGKWTPSVASIKIINNDVKTKFQEVSGEDLHSSGIIYSESATLSM